MFRREEGQILPGLMVLLVALLGLSTLVFQVGRAALLRSDAQTAADAAALAAARNVKAQLMTQLATRGYSDLALVSRASVEAAARDYAGRNEGVLVRMELVGADVKVWVSTDEELGEDAAPLDEEHRRGEAKARARLALSVVPGLGSGGGGVGGAAGGGTDVRIGAKDWGELGKEVGEPPKCSTDAAENDVVKLGRFLNDHGLVADENRQLGGDPPLAGEHSAGGWHYACGDSGAIDINADGAAGGEKAALDAIAGPIARLGFYVIWQEEDHFDHMHVQPRGGSPGFSGGSFTGYGSAGSLEDTLLEVKLVDWDAPMATGMLAGLVGGAGGVPFGPPDPAVARVACRVLDALNASAKARLALWEALIVESGVKNLTWGDASSVGVLQLLDIHGSVARRLDVEWVIREFLLNGFTGRGGAMAIARRSPGLSAGLVAQAVQGSARPWAYDQRAAQAAALDGKFCGGGGEGG
ncbi:MAG TPA: pilus assembly protein TadG-related protein [Solirubrobacteraceae bacterium]|jgi:hypothetical protein